MTPSPSTDPAPRPAAERAPASPPSAVLVVDDEEPVLRFCELVLRRRGIDVVTARDGAEALDVFRAHGTRIRAVLLDMTLPKKSGAEVAAEIRELRPATSIIGCSGYTLDRMGEAANCVDRFLDKPFTVEQLLDAFAQILETEWNSTRS